MAAAAAIGVVVGLAAAASPSLVLKVQPPAVDSAEPLAPPPLAPWRALLWERGRATAAAVGAGCRAAPRGGPCGCCRLVEEDAEAAVQCANLTGVPHARVRGAPPPRPRVLVVTQATKNLAGFAKYSCVVNAAWAAKFGHGFVVDEEPPKGSTEYRSGKIAVVRKWMDTEESADFEWLLWLDTDAIVANFAEDFLRRLLAEESAGKDVLVSRSLLTSTGISSTLNSGAVLYRRGSAWARGLLRRIEEDARFQSGTSDQETLEKLIHEDPEVAERVGLLHPLAMNSDAGGVTLEPNRQPVYHLYSHPDVLRASFFRHVWGRTCDAAEMNRRAHEGPPFRTVYAQELEAYVALEDDDVVTSGRPQGPVGAVCAAHTALKFDVVIPEERVDALIAKVDDLVPTYGEDHTIMGMGRQFLAQMLELHGRREEAEVLARKSVETHERGQGLVHPQTMNAMVTHSGILESLGREAEGARILATAAARSREAYGGGHQQTLRFDAGVARRWRTLGTSPKAAERDLRRIAGEWEERILGPDNPSTWELWEQLGHQVWDNGKFDEAWTWFERSRASYDRLEPGGADASAAAKTLAELRLWQGRQDEAESVLRRALDASTRGRASASTGAAGAGGWSVHASKLSNLLGTTLLDLGRVEEAEAQLRGSVAAAEAAAAAPGGVAGRGPSAVLSAVRVEALAGLAKAAQQARRQDAGSRWARALDEGRASLGEKHPLALHCATDFAEWLQRAGRGDEAEALARSALEAAGPHRLAERLRATNVLGVALPEAGRHDEAEALLRAAVDDPDARALAAGHAPLRAAAANNLAAVLLARGRVAEAEPLLREAMDLHKSRFKGDASVSGAGGVIETLDGMSVVQNLALVDLQQGRIDDAIAHQKQFTIGMRKVGTKKQSLDAQYMLAAMLLQRSKSEKGKSNDAAQALKLLRASCDGYTKLLGSGSAEATRCRANLAGMEGGKPG